MTLLLYCHCCSCRRALVLTSAGSVPSYGGVGQHRYCCGFSGDQNSEWMTLQAEVNITKTAANIGFAHWSHDIGGFSGNPTDELYVRWTQFGALSPLYRSHGTYGSDRMYWHYPSFALMKQSLQLRATLAPYVYTSAWRATHSGVGAVHSLYIDHPLLAEAYDTPSAQISFMHGADLLVRPVVTPVDAAAAAEVGPAPRWQTQPLAVWLPPSPTGWVLWNTSALVPGTAAAAATHATLQVTVADLPLFVRGGAALPLLPAGTLDVTRQVILNGCLCLLNGCLFLLNGCLCLLNGCC